MTNITAVLEAQKTTTNGKKFPIQKVVWAALNKKPQTQEELVGHLDLTSSQVSDALSRLRQKGFLAPLSSAGGTNIVLGQPLWAPEAISLYHRYLSSLAQETAVEHWDELLIPDAVVKAVDEVGPAMAQDILTVLKKHKVILSPEELRSILKGNPGWKENRFRQWSYEKKTSVLLDQLKVDREQGILEQDLGANANISTSSLLDPSYTSFWQTHEFWLRADLKVQITLPIDLTFREGDRLSNWMRSLPRESYLD